MLGQRRERSGERLFQARGACVEPFALHDVEVREGGCAGCRGKWPLTITAVAQNAPTTNITAHVTTGQGYGDVVIQVKK